MLTRWWRLEYSITTAWRYGRLKVWALRIGVTLPLIYLVVWAMNGGNNLGERAGLLQGVVALVLLWVTWVSIDRADRQISIAQQQLSNAGASERNHLLLAWISDDSNIHVSNLSKYPILLQEFYYLEPPCMRDRPLNIVGKVVQPSQTLDMGSEYLRITRYVQQQDVNARKILLAEDYESEDYQLLVEIKYMYVGTGSRIYTKLYEISSLVGNEFYSRNLKNWHPSMRLVDFYYEIQGVQDSTRVSISIRSEFDIPESWDDELAQEARHINRPLWAYQHPDHRRG